MNVNVKSQVHPERRILQDHIPLAAPLVVYLEPSGYCNLQCAFCPQGTDRKLLVKDLMSAELLEKMIDDLSLFPEKITLLRVCGNGEPLMNKNIVRMLRYAKEKKVVQKIELLTNGLLLNDDLIETLPLYLDRLIISVEGLNAGDYKAICSTNMDYQKFLDNLDKLYASKGKCIIHIKIHNEAVPTEDKRQLFMDTFSRCCDEIYIENLVPMWPELKTEHYIDEFRWGGGEITKRKVCAQIFKSVQVQADGEVVPCCVDWKRVNVIGNIKTDSLYEIWKGEKLKALQLAHLNGNKSEIEPCKDCTMNDYCEVDNIDGSAHECAARICSV